MDEPWSFPGWQTRDGLVRHLLAGHSGRFRKSQLAASSFDQLLDLHSRDHERTAVMSNFPSGIPAGIPNGIIHLSCAPGGFRCIDGGSHSPATLSPRRTGGLRWPFGRPKLLANGNPWGQTEAEKQASWPMPDVPMDSTFDSARFKEPTPVPAKRSQPRGVLDGLTIDGIDLKRLAELLGGIRTVQHAREFATAKLRKANEPQRIGSTAADAFSLYVDESHPQLTMAGHFVVYDGERFYAVPASQTGWGRRQEIAELKDDAERRLLLRPLDAKDVQRLVGVASEKSPVAKLGRFAGVPMSAEAAADTSQSAAVAMSNRGPRPRHPLDPPTSMQRANRDRQANLEIDRLAAEKMKELTRNR